MRLSRHKALAFYMSKVKYHGRDAIFCIVPDCKSRYHWLYRQGILRPWNHSLWTLVGQVYHRAGWI